MKQITYSLQFFSPWHCGSGMGGGDDADYRPVLDSKGFPYVPGKTIKGLCREASEMLHSQTVTEHLFGRPTEHDESDSTPGSVFWSNAELPQITRAAIGKQSNLLLAGRYFVKLDEHGLAANKNLRRGEYVIPMTLEGTVGNLTDADIQPITECLQFVKQLGLQRSRGFGRCQFSVVSTSETGDVALGKFKESSHYYFKCRFLTPVILNDKGATEGELDTLMYVPGSDFLGIAAQQYAAYGDKAFEVFHAGKVCFGNAYPLDGNGHLALPCPASWFIPKGGSLSKDEIYPTPERRKEVRKEKQPKQVRGGYFVPADKPAAFNGSLTKSFALKSAYDSDKRKTQDSEMFGYTSLNADTEWAFQLDVDASIPSELQKQLVSSLLGRHGIGRSRTAQYGAVEISLLADNPLKSYKPAAPVNDLHYLYVMSPLALLDAYGQPTQYPEVTDFGFPKDAILDTERSQILTRTYCPWNSTRKSRDAVRLIIQPGSVIVIKSSAEPDNALISKGVGLYLSEGYGKVLYNPPFLMCRGLAAAAEATGTQTKQMSYVVSDRTLIDYLDRKSQLTKQREKIFALVMETVNNPVYKRITPSQWGAVRAIAVAQTSYEALDKALFEKSLTMTDNLFSYEQIIKNGRDIHDHHPGFLVHGVGQKVWGTEAVKTLKNTLETVKEQQGEEAVFVFLELLASEMAKKATSKGGR